MVDSRNRGWTHIWQYGERHEKMTNLGGTYRTLDGIDGRCDLGDGILSQVSSTSGGADGSMALQKWTTLGR